MNDLEKHLQRLSELLSKRKENHVAQIESCLAGIVTLNDPDDIKGLLALLHDSIPDEILFSIIHTIERWDDQT